MLLASAYFIVESAVFFAEFAGLPRNLIGGTITAFGTSLPKFFIDIRAFLKGHSALAFGDIIGSAFLNITLILGITLIIPVLLGSTLTMSMQVFQDLAIFSLIANLLLWYFLSIGRLSLKGRCHFVILILAFFGNLVGGGSIACAADLGASDTPGSFICFQQRRSRHRQNKLNLARLIKLYWL